MRAKYIVYDIWGNKEDGYEVNNLFTVIDELIIEDKNNSMTCKEIVKAFNGVDYSTLSGIYKLNFDFRKIYIEDCWPDIEIYYKSGKPIGRVEITEEI